MACSCNSSLSFPLLFPFPNYLSSQNRAAPPPSVASSSGAGQNRPRTMLSNSLEPGLRRNMFSRKKTTRKQTKHRYPAQGSARAVPSDSHPCAFLFSFVFFFFLFNNIARKCFVTTHGKATTACTQGGGEPSAAQHLPGSVSWQRWQRAGYHLRLHGIAARNGFSSLSSEASCPRSAPAQHGSTSDRITAPGHAHPQADPHTGGCNVTVPRIHRTAKPTLGAALRHPAAPRMSELSSAT